MLRAGCGRHLRIAGGGARSFQFPPLESLLSQLTTKPFQLATTQAQQCGEVWLYVPHLAVGMQGENEWVTIVDKINRSADRKLIVFDYILTTNFTLQVRETFGNGDEVDATSGYSSIPSKTAGSTTLSYCRNNVFGQCTSNGLKTGWIRFRTTSTLSLRTGRCEPDIQISSVFQLRNRQGLVLASVGLPAMTGDSAHLMEAYQTPNIGIELAVANPNPATVTVTLRLYDAGVCCTDASGVRQPYLTTSFTLERGHQVSGMLNDFFKSNPGWRGNCFGCNMEISAVVAGTTTPTPVAALAIRADRATDGTNWLMSGIPIFPGRDQ